MNDNSSSLKPGMQLFKSEGFYEDAILQNRSESKWSLYAEGYKKAADRLIDHQIDQDSNVHENDYLVYPICFMYRQFIELRLKEILQLGSVWVDKEKDISRSMNTHNLADIWKYDVRPILEYFFPSYKKSKLDLAYNYIYQFLYTEEIKKNSNQLTQEEKDQLEIDPQSYAFRYPIGKNGFPVLMSVESISLVNLKNRMLEIGDFLDNCLLGIHHKIEIKTEIEIEMRDWIDK